MIRTPLMFEGICGSEKEQMTIISHHILELLIQSISRI